MVKVAYIKRVVSPYKLSYLKNLAQCVDLTVYYGRGEKTGAAQNAKIIEGFKHKRLLTLSLGFQSKTKSYYLSWFPALVFYLIKDSPEVIFLEGATNILNNIPVILFAKLARIPFIWSDAGRNIKLPMGIMRKMIEPLLIFLIKQSNACVTYGEMSKQYFLSIGVPNERIFIAQNTTDLGIGEEVKERYFEKIDEERKRLSLIGKKVILYVGSIEKRKKLDTLLKVFKEIKLQFNDWALLIIGDGPEKNNIEEIVMSEYIKDVYILGRIVEEIGLYFMLCDLLVLPGSSSLAINQAMFYGKPVITVAYGGPEYELIKNGENGFVLDRGNEQQLKEAIVKVIGDDEARVNMGRVSLNLIKRFKVEDMAAQVVQAINYAKNYK